MHNKVHVFFGESRGQYYFAILCSVSSVERGLSISFSRVALLFAVRLCQDRAELTFFPVSDKVHVRKGIERNFLPIIEKQ